MYYQITDKLCHLSPEEKEQHTFFAAVMTSQEWDDSKADLGFPVYAGLEPASGQICKAEVYSKYIFGSIAAPDHKQVLGMPHKLLYYINERGIVFLDENGLADKIIGNMVPKYENRDMNPEFFIYSFLSEFLDDDIEFLEQYENMLFAMEEDALNGNIHNLMPRLLTVRRELTRMRYYYEQLEDMARELEGNVPNFFDCRNTHGFHLFADRANRLAGMAQQSIEYCHTLRDIYQAAADHKQDKNMQLLTILTSIFFPLTVITGWYGMNFSNMPELHAKYGYPIIILISLCVILFELFFLFKIRHRKL